MVQSYDFTIERFRFMLTVNNQCQIGFKSLCYKCLERKSENAQKSDLFYTQSQKNREHKYRKKTLNA